MYTCPICRDRIEENKVALPAINFNNEFSFTVACRCNSYYHKNCLQNQLNNSPNNIGSCATCRTRFTHVGERYKIALPIIRYLNRCGIKLDRNRIKIGCCGILCAVIMGIYFICMAFFYKDELDEVIGLDKGKK